MKKLIYIFFFLLACSINAQEVVSLDEIRLGKSDLGLTNKEPQRFAGNPEVVAPLDRLKDLGLTNKEPLDFFPIGWSRDGNFAWVIKQPNGMVGSYIRLVVQNTKSDQIIEDINLDDWRLKKDSSIWLPEDWENEKQNNDGRISPKSPHDWRIYNEKYIKYLWNLLDLEIKEVLDRHGIVKEKKFFNYENISTKQGKPFEIKYSIIKKFFKQSEMWGYWDSPDDIYIERSIGFQINISNEKGSKRITSTDSFVKSDGMSNVYIIDNIRFVGAFKSPYEERLAIINAFTTFDYQRDPDGDNIYISGCSLLKGFR